MLGIKREGFQALQNVLKNAVTSDAHGGITINGQKVEAGELEQYLEITASTVDKVVAEKSKEYVEAAAHGEVVAGTLSAIRTHSIIKP